MSEQNYLVYKDQLDNDVIKLLNKTGDTENLVTENKSVVGALNEIIGKDIIAEKFGTPLVPTDTWAQMGNGIESVENKLRTKLTEKNVDTMGANDINELVDKIDDIYEINIDKEVLFNNPRLFINPPYDDETIDFSLCDNNGKLYAIGGTKGSTRTSNIMQYDFLTSKWAKVSDIQESSGGKYAISAPRLTSTSMGIFIFGGLYGNDSSTYHFLFDTITNTCTNKINIPKRRDCYSVERNDDIVYIHGSGVTNQVNQYYVYNKTTNTVTTEILSSLTSMNSYTHIDNIVYSFNVMSLYATDLNLKTLTTLIPKTEYNMNTMGLFPSSTEKLLYMINPFSRSDNASDAIYDVDSNSIVKIDSKLIDISGFSSVHFNDNSVYIRFMMTGTQHPFIIVTPREFSLVGKEV